MKQTYINILRLMADGFTCKEIADKLELTDATIETYKIKMCRKFQVKNAPQLVAYALRNNLIK